MYRVVCDGFSIYDLRDEELILGSPKVILADNSAGSFEFTIYPNHPHYGDIQKMQSSIQVFDNDEEIFCGRVTSEKKNFKNAKTIHCEGELAYLNDSIQRPAVYRDLTVRGYLTKLIQNHNKQVDSDRHFRIGEVSVVDSNNYVYKYTNYESTMQVIKTDLIDTYGGHIRLRKENGYRYIDYLADYSNKNTQVIQFGQNLLDFTNDIDASDIATAIIPLGAKQEESSVQGFDERLTIKSVNNGVDYVHSDSAVRNHGWIFKTVKFDNVNVPGNLKTKGEQYLKDIQFENVTLTVKALDFHMINFDIEKIKMLDEIRVVSDPNGLDRWFPVTKMTIHLDKPSSNTITLGQKVSSGMTGTASSNNAAILKRIDEIPSETKILKEAQENATSIIKNSLNGFVKTSKNEILIMDTDDVETAQRVWRWNVAGLGYSNTGYNGDFETAMTMEGQIVGERIKAGSISSEKLDIQYRSSVEKAISDAQENAEEHTNEELKKYWTREEVETAIQTSKDSILLSVKETATAYTDEKLTAYATYAQLKVKTDSIESEVRQKINSSDFSTMIQQNATAIKVAWNNISKYIQFESGELRIYDSSVQSRQKLRSKFDSEGEHFYRNDYYVGKIGTNEYSKDETKKGLEFDLEQNGSYMTWASKSKSSDSNYTMKWTYVNKGKSFGNYTDDTLHAGCDIDMHGWTLKNVSFEGGGINGTVNFVQVRSMNSDGTVSNWSTGCKLKFKNGILIEGAWD